MTETKSNAVAKKPEAGLPANIFEEDASLTQAGLTQDDLATPRLKILMNGSDELDANDALKPGQIFNTVTGEAFDGKEGIVVIPCGYERQYVEWEERETGSGAPVNIFKADSDILTKTTRNSKNKDMLECTIYEVHHTEKVDSPSGTAIELKEIIENNNKCNFVSSINIESERVSNVNGIHEVRFSNNKDLVTFKHEALSRNIFSDGAIAIAKSIIKKEPDLYSVKDFFN